VISHGHDDTASAFKKYNQKKISVAVLPFIPKMSLSKNQNALEIIIMSPFARYASTSLSIQPCSFLA
jgi:hypothetical protein